MTKTPLQRHQPQHQIRIVMAASLFDGHDATINIIRRLLQEFGAEVIHLGHNRSVSDVVRAVLQEGAQGVCISSYQGGHMEYFKYMRDLLDAAGADYVKIYGGGGGVIVYDEKKELEAYGIAQIFHPDDGRRLGLEGMINMIIEGCDFDPTKAAGVTGHSSSERGRAPAAKNAVAHMQVDQGNPVPGFEIGNALNLVEETGKAPKASDVGLSAFMHQ